MQWLRAVPCLALGTMLAGCDPQPAEPTSDVVVPALGATHDDWIATEGYPDEGFPDYVECYNDGAGEPILWFGSYQIHYYSTTTPSGNTTLHWKIDYPSATLSALGLLSGDVWSIVRGEDTGAQIIKPGEAQVYHWQANEHHRNQDGDEVHLSFRYQLHIDADGTVAMERFDGYCPGKP